MVTANRRGVQVTRRCMKNGRRHVEMVCEVGNYKLAAEMARQFNMRDDSHVYAFSWRTTARRSIGFWSDLSQDFDVESFFRKLDGVPEPVNAFR